MRIAISWRLEDASDKMWVALCPLCPLTDYELKNTMHARSKVVGISAAVRWMAGAALLLLSLNADGTELIVNGSFEAEGQIDSGRLTGWNDGSLEGAATLQYPYGDCGTDWCGGTAAFDVPGTPSSGVSGPLGRGDYYAHAFGTGIEMDGMVHFEGFAAQNLVISQFSRKPFIFSTWLASRSGIDDDFAVVALEFFDAPDATGGSLGELIFNGNDQQSPFIVGSANEEGLADPSIAATQDNWTLYRTSGLIPDGAVSASVSIAGRAVTGRGFVNDGFVDLVSLQVVPEPASVVLLLLGLLPALPACRFRPAWDA
jgi:hypothetical protein